MFKTQQKLKIDTNIFAPSGTSYHLPHRGRKCAFTLAEVLITLGVIGVVAAMTLPTVIKKYQQKVTVERLKSAYSTLYQAIKMSEIDNGPTTDWEFPSQDANLEIQKDFMEKHFTPYLKNIKICQTYQQCLGKNAYHLDGTQVGSRIMSRYVINLPNGVAVAFWARGEYKIIDIAIDINGSKGPNIVGKDIFYLLIDNKGDSNYFFGKNQPVGSFHFYGQGKSNNDLKTKDYACSKTLGTNLRGTYCGALIMQSGWKIPDGYPW